jgi:hypothetical protein
MGSLIMLLVLLMQQARATAADTNRDRLAQLTKEQNERSEQLKMQVEDESWRADVLTEQRQELQQQITDRRLKLAHLEQHIRDLDAQWKSLQAQAAEIAKLHDFKSADVQPLEEEKNRVERQLSRAREQLDQARQALSQSPRSYAIIPYPGPNGTTRRPIYIECSEQGVILQPENIVLTADDFQEPLGPGNPLDSAIRTIHAQHKRALADPNSASYPLLIVRPNGVAAYAAARAAMASWEDEFGYELVDQDMELSYPPPDPGLAAALEEAIQASRQRQEIRRHAMPVSRSRGGGSFVVSPYHGGLRSLDGDDEGETGDGPGLGIGSGSGGTAASGFAAPSRQGSDENAGVSNQGTTASGPGGGSRSGGGRSGAGGAPGNGAAGGGGTSGGTSGGTPGGGFGGSQSLAGSRGEDWALHKKRAGATGYRRPVRVICRDDALILVPEALSNDKPKVFRFEDDATKTIDGFVKSLHQRMDLWGLPPLNGYWRPQLVVQIETNGEARYGLLEELLRNSGLELKREKR